MNHASTVDADGCAVVQVERLTENAPEVEVLPANEALESRAVEASGGGVRLPPPVLLAGELPRWPAD